ncbi:MAG: Yip1 family protein [Gemmatimonadales bacterium]
MALVSRVKGILMTPKAEWAVIDDEPTTVGSLYTSYIIPLAAIAPICRFIGMSLVGYNLVGVAVKWPVDLGLESAIVQYALSLVSVYVLALIIDALAPNFGGHKNSIQALKVAAYSSTAAWVAGVFLLLPALGILTILGLYSFYLMFLGLPVLMKAPEEKAAGYVIVAVVCAVVLYVIVGAITSRVFAYPGMNLYQP